MRETSLGFIRKRFTIQGNLHGSGFAAAIFRLVRSLNLRGWMRPFSLGYEVQLEGDEGTLRGFESQLLSRFEQSEYQFHVKIEQIDTKGDISFYLIEPEEVQAVGRWILPDKAQCPDCVAEMLNPNNRRFFYPFTFCADCGPKYSIARQGLLQRTNTLFADFPLCEQCLAEFGNSRDRRFLHSLNTCPICGPGIQLIDHSGIIKSRQREALIQSATMLEEGGILAVKEVSGFSLIALATSDEPIRRIRALLDQVHQPIPIIVQSVDAVDAFTITTTNERQWLKQLDAPILRAKKRAGSLSLANQIAPFGSHLDIGLPNSGMLHLLLNLLNLPLAVVSSLGQRVPYACTEKEALSAFDGLVNFMLVSSLPLLRSTPNSLIQRVGDQTQVLRQGVGNVPFEIKIPGAKEELMALGGKSQTSIGLNIEGSSFLLGPMGSLGEDTSLDFFFDSLQDSKKLFSLKPSAMLADFDPNALTTRYALSTDRQVQQIEHDLAHVMVGIPTDIELSHVMGICFDEGIGRDKQGTLSGGECLWLDGKQWQRIAQFDSFWLPGGDSATSDNRSCLFGMLYEVFGLEMWDALPLKLRAQLNLHEIEHWNQVFDRKLQCCRTRSVKNWWLGLTALLLGTHRNRYQGDAFSAIEASMDSDVDMRRAVKPYNHTIVCERSDSSMIMFKWKSILREVVTDMQQGRHPHYILRRVFQTFSNWILKLSAALHPKYIVLSGSAFENRIWTEHMMATLSQHGFKVCLPGQIPMNDSGLALGQILASYRDMNLHPTEIDSVSDALSKITSPNTQTNTNQSQGNSP